MLRALITGVNGFTGIYMKNELEARGYEVFGTVFGKDTLEEKESSVDLCDQNAVAEVISHVKPDIVAHFAGVAFAASKEVDKIYVTNVLGARNLLYALSNNTKKPTAVLLISSAHIYGNTETDPINEDVVANPNSDYAVSKLSLEYMAKLWRDKLPIIIARPFNYTGVGQSSQFLIPKIIEHHQRISSDIEMGNIDVARDFSDVRSVVNAYAKLLEIAPAGEVYNVCSGQVYTLSEVLQMMSHISGYKINVVVNPSFVRHDEVKYLRGSNEKLKAAIGEFNNIPLNETLEWMYKNKAVV